MDENLFEGSPSDIIERLKDKAVQIPIWSKLETDYDPTKHKIVKDNTTRRDKTLPDGGVDKASRIHIGLENFLTARIRYGEMLMGIYLKRRV